jgi:hypothetical protein
MKCDSMASAYQAVKRPSIANTPISGLFRSHFYPPFVKGGWGDFGAVTSGKSPLTPLCQRGERNQGTENCMTLYPALAALRFHAIMPVLDRGYPCAGRGRIAVAPDYRYGSHGVRLLREAP